MNHLLVAILLLASAMIKVTESFSLSSLFRSKKSQAQVQIYVPDGVPADYPAQEIANLIQKNPDFYREQFADESIPNTESRFLDPDVVDLCEVTYSIEIPTQLERASDGQKLFIAQHFGDDSIKQRIRHVLCKSTSHCSFTGFPATLESFCKQEYSERKLYAHVNGSLVYETFLSPSCCTCHLKRMYGDVNLEGRVWTD